MTRGRNWRVWRSMPDMLPMNSLTHAGFQGEDGRASYRPWRPNGQSGSGLWQTIRIHVSRK